MPAACYYKYPSMLELWEEGQSKQKTNFIDRIGKLFSKKKIYKQQTITLAQPSVVSVPRVSLIRSASAVTAMSSYNLAIITGKMMDKHNCTVPWLLTYARYLILSSSRSQVVGPSVGLSVV